MGKINVLKVIFWISLFLFAANLAYAECYNEDTCYKDFVSEKDKDVVVAVNRETSAVELYWADKDQAWAKPDAVYQAQLQKMYDKKMRLRRMQERLDRMHRDSWYNTNQSSNAHR